MTKSARASVLAAIAALAAMATSHSWMSPEVPLVAAGRSCESLATLALPNATVTSSATMAAGAFTPPGAAAGNAGAARTYSSLPAFCRVAATLKPTADSDIKVEVWLPAAGWNGKFQAVGNGGLGGTISYPALAAAIAEGYASASTDTGHVGGDAKFAVGHQEKIVDFGYRSVHEMTVQAKSILDAFYGSAPKLSFWNSCSGGGRQGINEAMRYPADYNAIVAGASSVNQPKLDAVRVALNQTVNRNPDGFIPPEMYQLVHGAAVQACDANDGVKDGVIDNPARCRFDPEVIQCKGPASPSCLTSAQVDTARTLYAPVTDPKSGREFAAPLLLPGSELGWATLAGRKPYATATDRLKYLIFRDPSWNPESFNASTDIDRAIKMDNNVIGLADPNLKPFFDRGGKLLMYQGWADPQMPANNSVTYFNSVVTALGRGAVGKSIQLYMVPGMGHCQGGPGTDTFDKMAAIEKWVASGSAPTHLPASHATNGKIDKTRPVCPYGQYAKWSGKGSTDDAANFACTAAP